MQRETSYYSYTLYHGSRKSFSTVKGTMKSLWTIPWILNETVPFTNDEEKAERFMGLLDFSFELAYAVGLFIFGGLSDRMEPRIVLGIGMCLTGVTTLIFGTLTEWLHFYSPLFYLVIWTLTGLFQASGFPSEISVMGNWFGIYARGLIFGLWASCQSLGNILGSYIAAVVLPYGYENVFLVHSTLMVSFSGVVLCGLVSSPKEIGLGFEESEKDEKDEKNSQTSAKNRNSEDIRPPPIGFIHAIKLPGVICYCFAYACVKMVHYSIFFWLPYYLENNFGWSNAVSDSLSTFYDWGAIFGGIFGGMISDCIKARNSTVVGMLLCSIGALFAYAGSPNDKVTNSLLMGITGVFVGGTANIISAAVSADLGSQPEIQGNSEALATVTGLIDGTGSFGAATGQLLVPLVQQLISWTAVFYMFMILILGAMACLLPMVFNDIKRKGK